MLDSRTRLRAAARRIAANRGESPASPGMAFRKLFVQERRDWKAAGAPRIGWKRGEVIEVIQAIGSPDFSAEWGDVGYYAAQSWEWVWFLYAIVTPAKIIERACAKFEARAKGSRK
jgi:hypothetical protein